MKTKEILPLIQSAALFHDLSQPHTLKISDNLGRSIASIHRLQDGKDNAARRKEMVAFLRLFTSSFALFNEVVSAHGARKDDDGRWVDRNGDYVDVLNDAEGIPSQPSSPHSTPSGIETAAEAEELAELHREADQNPKPEIISFRDPLTGRHPTLERHYRSNRYQGD